MEKIDTSTEAVTKMMDGVTPGPWELDGIAISGNDAHQGDVCLMGEPAQYAGDFPRMLNNCEANAHFIRAARDLVPALLAERDALKSEVERLKAQPVTVQDAARVLLTAREQGQIDVEAVKLFLKGQPVAAMRAIAEGRA